MALGSDRLSETLRFDGIEVQLFAPAGTGRAPALVFLHERYGLVQHTLDLAAMAAADGYVGVAPDLFSRWRGDREALRRGEVRVLLPDPEIASVLHATVDGLKRHPRVDPRRIVVVGVCQSGRYAVALASERQDLAACVVLYGAAQERDWMMNAEQPRALTDLIRSVGTPFLFIFGEADHVIALADVRRLRGAFEEADKSYRMRVFARMPHGWLNDTMPGRYRAAEAALAWRMVIDFTSEVFAGDWTHDGRVRSEFTSDIGSDYDFTKNVRLE